jgi:tetratricopeptide (TPR) repeat protein
MWDAPFRQAAVAEELTEWWEDLWQRDTGSRVVLAEVPPGWGRTTVLDHFAAVVSRDDAPVSLLVRINGKDLPEEAGMQALALRRCLAEAGGRHRVAELLGLDRLDGVVQLGLGVGSLFVSGLAAAVSFLVAGMAMGAAGKAWDDGPAGQEGALARTARAVAALSVSAPVTVIADDADSLNPDLALTLMENLVARHNGQVLVVAAVDPGGDLAAELTSRARLGLIEGLVHTAEADPDMGYQSRVDLAHALCPRLPDAMARRIARRTLTFADVFAVTAGGRLSEVSPDEDEAQMLAAVDTVINARLQDRPPPSAEAVVIAWAGGLVHARQLHQAVAALGATQDAAARDVRWWGGLARLADPASPRLAEQVAALPASTRQSMATIVLDVALSIAAEPDAELVDRLVALQAAHRVRADLATGSRLPRAQCRLTADLETLGDVAAAMNVATEALAKCPPDEFPHERDLLAATVLRLARASPQPRAEPLVEELIAAAVASGAAVGLEARIWAAIDLLDAPGRRETALALIDEVTADLEGGHGLGAAGGRWRLLLAFHAGRVGYRTVTQRLLAPMISSGGQEQNAAQAVLYAVTGLNADTRLQVIMLEAELSALPPDADDDRLRLHHTLAADYAAVGDYRKALEHGQHELKLHNLICSPSHPSALTIRASIAYFTGSSGDTGGALHLYRELLPDQQRILGPDHPDTLTTRNNIARWTGEHGDRAEALRLSRELLPDRERALGLLHPGTLITRSSIARWTGQCGDHAEALRLSWALLPDQQRVLGPDHPDTLTTRNNIAGWTGQCGDHNGALHLYRELLPDQQRVLGPDHPDTLTTRNNIAVFTEGDGDHAEALRLFRELLPDRERALGPDHPDTLTTRNNIAYCTSYCGGHAEALRLFRELLPDLGRVLGPDHPDTLTTRNNIADSSGRCGDNLGALRLYRELLPDQERVLGPSHQHTLITRSNIAYLTELLRR